MPSAVRINSPTTNSERHKRFVGSHPYPALPRSRLPYLRALFWIGVGVVAAFFRAIRRLFRRRPDAPQATEGVHTLKPCARDDRSDARDVTARVPSLTPI